MFYAKAKHGMFLVIPFIHLSSLLRSVSVMLCLRAATVKHWGLYHIVKFCLGKYSLNPCPIKAEEFP